MLDMKTQAKILSLACSAILAAPPCLAQESGQVSTEAAELVTRLVDPSAPANSEQEPASGSSFSNVMKSTVNSLLINQDVDDIRLLGEAAIPALEALTREAKPFDLLKRNSSGHPVYALREVSSTRGLEFLLELQRDDPSRFDVLMRTGYTPLSYEKWSFTWDVAVGANKAAATRMLSAALENATYSKTEKIKIACIAFERDVQTEASRKLIAQDLDAAIVGGLGPKGVQEFIPSDGDVAQLSLRQARALADTTSNGAVLIALVGSPDPRVRERAVEQIGRDPFGTDIQRTIVEAALDDVSPDVAQALHWVIVGTLPESNAPPSRAFLTRIAQFYGRVQLRDSDDTHRLSTMMINAITSARTAEDLSEVELLVKAVYDAPLADVHEKMSAAFYNALNAPKIAAAVYRGRVASQHATSGTSQHILKTNRPKSPVERAVYALDTYTAHDPGTDSTQLTYFTDDLSQLPIERYSEALNWLGRTGAHFDFCCGSDPSSWMDGAEAFRQSAYDETAPWKERAMAIIGLFSSIGLNDEDAARCGDILGKGLADVAQRELFLKLLGIRNSTVERPLGRQWNGAVARIYAAGGIPTGIKEQLPLSNAPTDPVILQEMLDTAGAQAIQPGGVTRFGSLGYATAPLAAQGVLDIPDSLLTNWISTGVEVTNLVTFLLAAEQVQPKNRYRGLMIDALKSSDTLSEMKIFTQEILRFPAADSAVKLIDAATALNSSFLTQEVHNQISRLLKLRSLRSQWTATEELPTKSSAVVELLGLLKSGSEVVRLEAMRGLGTMGAVEALPQLIGFVDTGTEQEKARALEVLAQLNERATQAPAGAK